jgi:hypothetical protein
MERGGGGLREKIDTNQKDSTADNRNPARMQEAVAMCGYVLIGN